MLRLLLIALSVSYAWAEAPFTPNSTPKKDSTFTFNVKAGGDEKVGLAALSEAFLNMQTYRLVGFPADKVKEGKVTGYFDGILSDGAKKVISEADPTMACTGQVRVNALAAHLSKIPNYYEANSAPLSALNLKRIYGISDRPAESMIISEKGNGTIQQAYFRRGMHGWCVQVDYYNLNSNRVSVEALQRSIRYEAPDATKWICQGMNGYPKVFYYNAKGERIDFFPVDFSGSQPTIFQNHLRQFFELASSPLTPQLASMLRETRSLKQQTGAFIKKTTDTLAKVAKSFDDNVSLEQAAKELGTTAWQVSSVMPKPQPREIFEKNFCKYYQMLHPSAAEDKGTHE